MTLTNAIRTFTKLSVFLDTVRDISPGADDVTLAIDTYIHTPMIRHHRHHFTKYFLEKHLPKILSSHITKILKFHKICGDYEFGRDDYQVSKMFYPLNVIELNTEQQKLLKIIGYIITTDSWLQQPIIHNWNTTFIIFDHVLPIFKTIVQHLSTHNLKIPDEWLNNVPTTIDKLYKYLTALEDMNHQPYTENNFIKYMINMANTHSFPLISKLLELFTNKGIIFNIEILISVISKSDFYSRGHVIACIIKSQCLSKLLITSDQFYKIFEKCDHYTYIEYIINECNIPTLSSHVEYLCTFQINTKILSKLLTLKVPTETMLTNVIKHSKNIDLVKLLLDNKIIPTPQHVYGCFDSKFIEPLLKILMNYGLKMTPELYTYVRMMNVNVPDVGINISPNIKSRLDVFTEKRKKFTMIKNIENLRTVFKTYLFEDLKHFLHNSSNVQPDELCFVNSLFNTDDNVMHYVFDTYPSFIPQIIDIIRIEHIERRYFVLHKFYPELAQVTVMQSAKTRHVEMMEQDFRDVLS